MLSSIITVWSSCQRIEQGLGFVWAAKTPQVVSGEKGTFLCKQWCQESLFRYAKDRQRCKMTRVIYPFQRQPLFHIRAHITCSLQLPEPVTGAPSWQAAAAQCHKCLQYSCDFYSPQIMIYSRHKLTVRRVRDKLLGPELFITLYSWGPTDTCRGYSVLQLKIETQ